MKQFVYIIAEGTLDVVVLTQILEQMLSLEIVKEKSVLPPEANAWLDQFKWPHEGAISRRAVPAPAFLQNNDFIVGIRNAEGIDKIRRVMNADSEFFLRINWTPSCAAIILDADDDLPINRFADFAELLHEYGYPKPLLLEEIASIEARRAGVFALPGAGKSGTLEDILLPLAGIRFPELKKHAEKYVQDWISVQLAQVGRDHKELNKPSGYKKAQLSSMVALLKPAKPLVSSIEDQKWLPEKLRDCIELEPLIQFLEKVFDRHASGQ